MTDTATLGTIEHIDPNQIEVETNIRTTVKLDPAFVASIREYGVLTPVGCRRNEDGTVSLRIGQRRVLAAREVGLTGDPRLYSG
jgi:ParB family chromosome partitioning protein